MSGISSATGFGALGTVLYNAGLTRTSIDTLIAQSSSGLISAEYSGLGSGAGSALDLSGQMALNATAQGDAAQAADVNQVTQGALGQVQTLVSGLSSQLLSPSTITNAGLSALAASARDALTQVAGLLNTQVGQAYVFAGQDSRSPPVPNASNILQSTFFTTIQTAVAGLSVSGAASVQAQALAAAAPGATSPFSASLEASNQQASADLGNGQTVKLGVLADENADAVSAGTGTTSTGSYMRDALMALSTIGAMGSDSAADTQVQSLLSAMRVVLSGSNDAINTDIGGLGARQNTISAAQTELSSTATAFTTQLGALQDADPAAVATNLSNAQTQLQASYKIIAGLAQLSLAKFL